MAITDKLHQQLDEIVRKIEQDPGAAELPLHAVAEYIFEQALDGPPPRDDHRSGAEFSKVLWTLVVELRNHAAEHAESAPTDA